MNWGGCTHAEDFARKFHLNYLQATRIISAAELQFRQLMIGFGLALSQGEATAVSQISAQLSVLTEQLYNLTIQPEFIQAVIKSAMGYCADEYMDAINNGINATIRGDCIQMGPHGFNY
jgi:hypothetical protein